MANALEKVRYYGRFLKKDESSFNKQDLILNVACLLIHTAKIDENQLNFVPSSGPFTRGIFANATITLKSEAKICAADLYKDEKFVRVVDSVAIANIVGSNYCDVSYELGNAGEIIAQGALDNLVKGAAGCAVQNMNIMCDFDEQAGLNILSPLYP